jgi:hypothetical protein
MGLLYLYLHLFYITNTAFLVCFFFFYHLHYGTESSLISCSSSSPNHFFFEPSHRNVHIMTVATPHALCPRTHCVLPHRPGFGIKQCSRGFLKRLEETTGAKIQLSNTQHPAHRSASRSRYKCLNFLLRQVKSEIIFLDIFFLQIPRNLATLAATRLQWWRARVHKGKWILHGRQKRYWVLLIGSDKTKPQRNGTRRIETAL